MIARTRIALGALVLVLQACGAANQPPPPRLSAISLQDVRARIDQAPTEHPRLFATADALAALRDLGGDPDRAILSAAVLEQARVMLDLPPVERTLQGRRLLEVSQQVVKRVLTLAMAYHLSEEIDFAQRAQEEMLAVAAFSDWNPSHFLDVAEMTFAMGVGYDWLHHQLDPAAREVIRTAIVTKGIAQQFDGGYTDWVRATNNWAQVGHGGLTAGALAVMEDEPDLAARTVHSAVQNVTYSMEVYAPKGSYPEGPGYWSYGTAYNVLLIAALDGVLGTDFGVSEAPGFETTGQYLALATGPTGQFFNYSDGSARRPLQPPLFWFAQRYARPDWLVGEHERLRAALDRLGPEDASSTNDRFLPLTLLWMAGASPDAAPGMELPLHWSGEGETPITVHRSSWTDTGATYVGLKGGSPSANHGQMDIGSFVLEADGVRWAHDLGAESYQRVEALGLDLWNQRRGSDRWKIFRQQNLAHNTLVIDGELQSADGHGEVVAFSDDPAFPHSIMDLSSVYEGQARSVRRGIALLPSGAVLIQDELRGLSEGANVRWGMLTRGEVDETTGTTLTLRQRRSSLQLNLLYPSSPQWRVVDTASPRNEWDSSNGGTRMVVFDASAPSSGELILVTLLVPGSVERQSAVEWRPLASWSDPAAPK